MFGLHGGRHSCGKFATHGPWGGWGRGAGGGGPWSGRGEGRRRRMFDGSELRLILLRLIADAPRHGYELIRAIEERSGGAYAPSPGVVYPTLTMLDEMGLIEEARLEGARKQFAVTGAGRAELEEKAAEVASLFERLEGLGAGRGVDPTPVRRAMANLGAVLQHRLGNDRISAETLHEIAALLDSTAQRIERLP